jgi:hypothetical protein
MSENTPKLTTRNELGLIDTVTYAFNEDGSIDWRKMINPKYLVPNKQVFDKRKKEIPQSIEGLEDKELLILLHGLKELAKIRGFSSVEYKVSAPSDSCILAVCSISWIPNYETENRPVLFSAIGDATPFNTNGFGRTFLGPIAENRSFVRCVRNFLRINITGQDEIGGQNPSEEPSQESSQKETIVTPASLLNEVMKGKKITFEQVKSKLKKEGFKDADVLSSLEEIPKVKIFELIERIKNYSQC